VSEDIPADVSSALLQLFVEAEEALEAGDIDTCLQTIESAETVATNELPECALRGQIRHGCVRVRALLEGDEEQDAEAAGEFLTAMQRRIPDK